MLSTSNISNINPSIKFGKHKTFYEEIYHQIDLIRKYKVSSEISTKEKEDQLLECKSVINELNKKIIDLKVENEKIKLNLKHHEQSKNELLEKLESLNNIEKIIRTHLVEYEAKLSEIEETKSKLLIDNDMKLKAITNLNERIDSIEKTKNKEIEDLKFKYDKMINEYESTLSCSKNEINNFKIKINDLEMSVKEKNDNITILTEKIEDLNKNLDEKINDFVFVNEKIKLLEDEKIENLKKIQDKDNLLAELITKNDKMENELLEKCLIINENIEKEKLFEDKIKINEEKLKDFEVMIVKLNEKSNDQILFYENLISENIKKFNDLNNDYEISLNRENTLISLKETYRLEVISCNEKIVELTNNILNLNEIHQICSLEKSNIENELELIKTESKNINNELIDSKNLIESKDEDINELKKMLEKFKNDAFLDKTKFDEQINEIKEKNILLMEMLEEKNKNICDFKDENNSLKLTINKLELNIENFKLNEIKLNNDLKNNNLNMQSSFEKYKNDFNLIFQKKDLEINDLRSKLDKQVEIERESQKQLKNLYENLHMKNEEIVNLMKKICSLEELNAKNAIEVQQQISKTHNNESKSCGQKRKRVFSKADESSSEDDNDDENNGRCYRLKLIDRLVESPSNKKTALTSTPQNNISIVPKKLPNLNVSVIDDRNVNQEIKKCLTRLQKRKMQKN